MPRAIMPNAIIPSGRGLMTRPSPHWISGLIFSPALAQLSGSLRVRHVPLLRALLLVLLFAQVPTPAVLAEGLQPEALPETLPETPLGTPPSAPDGVLDGSSEQAADSLTSAPVSELDADLLFAILAAEVAMQRDRPQDAVPRYMAAAQRTADPRLAELATRAAMAAGDQVQAEESAAFWIALDPASLQARQIAAYIILEAGQVDRVLPYLRAVMEHSPQLRQGYLNNARLVARLEDPRQRLELMRALIDEYGEDPDALLAIASLAVGAGEKDLARGYAERAAAQRPAWSRPPQFLAQLLVSEGRADEAIGELERYFSQGFDDLELRTLYAQLLIDAERYEAAREVFETLLDAQPQMPGVLFAAAMLSLQLADYDAARDYLLRLRDSGERKQDATFMLGQTEEAAEQLELARDWYLKVRGDRELDAQIRLASLEARMGQLGLARERLQRLRLSYPERQPAFYQIEAEILRDLDEFTVAMTVYDLALEQFPDNADLLYARALLAARLKQVDLLERDLRRVLSMNPDHADALNALGYTLADQTDRLDEAQRFITRALELEPEQPAILDSMGWLLYRMGKPGEAEPYLRSALEQLADGEIAAHLGAVLWALGRHDEARQVWQQALDDYPDHDYLLQLIEGYPVSLTPGSGS